MDGAKKDFNDVKTQGMSEVNVGTHGMSEVNVGTHGMSEVNVGTHGMSEVNVGTHEPCVPTVRTALSVVIGGFKRSVTLYARRNDINFAWQSRYHDHIIRGFNDFNKIGEYIRNNVGKWEEDCFFQM